MILKYTYSADFPLLTEYLWKWRAPKGLEDRKNSYSGFIVKKSSTYATFATLPVEYPYNSGNRSIWGTFNESLLWPTIPVSLKSS